MIELDELNALMTELGPKLDALQVKHFEGKNFWTVLFDEAVLLYVDLDPARQTLVVSADVAEPLPEARLARYEMILQYNNLWTETGGLRMALDSPEGVVVLLVDVPLAGITRETLATLCGNFVEAVHTWREILERPLDTGGDTPPADEDAFIVRV